MNSAPLTPNETAEKFNGHVKMLHIDIWRRFRECALDIGPARTASLFGLPSSIVEQLVDSKTNELGLFAVSHPLSVGLANEDSIAHTMVKHLLIACSGHHQVNSNKPDRSFITGNKAGNHGGKR